MYFYIFATFQIASKLDKKIIQNLVWTRGVKLGFWNRRRTRDTSAPSLSAFDEVPHHEDIFLAPGFISSGGWNQRRSLFPCVLSVEEKSRTAGHLKLFRSHLSIGPLCLLPLTAAIERNQASHHLNHFFISRKKSIFSGTSGRERIPWLLYFCHISFVLVIVIHGRTDTESRWVWGRNTLWIRPWSITAWHHTLVHT